MAFYRNWPKQRGDGGYFGLADSEEITCFKFDKKNMEIVPAKGQLVTLVSERRPRKDDYMMTR